MIALRFVTTNDIISAGIRLAENYTFSHVEAVMPDGSLLGAHADGGVLARPSDYDKDVWTYEMRVPLNMSAEMEQDFIARLQASVGTPYDMAAILGFLLRKDMHTPQHMICSALQTWKLRQCGYFSKELAVPAHQVSPRDLALMLSVREGLVPIATNPLTVH